MFSSFRNLRGLPQTMFAICSLLVANLVLAASPLFVNLSSDASHPAANDLMQATLSAEATGASPGELSGQVNQAIANALDVIRDYPAVKAQSSGMSAYPVYAAGDGSIQGWRMRSDISLESGDTSALSELLGNLQTSLVVSNLRLLPSPETRRKAEDKAILDAITLFKVRAQLLANAQKGNYRIEELSISTGGHFAPVPLRSNRSVATMAAPMPIESGESMINAKVSGKIKIE
ncbi:MAG: SIMPL domain-containing protein [Candidatus Accumulibacter sp.]|jgi:predicted secreted protein|nr:SIMPL domain-containing protein [Accumulibacter sp.]